MILNVAVIGGSGFIGTRLINRLEKKSNIIVTILDKTKSTTFPQLWKHCDIEKIETLRGSLSNADIVVNLAAEHRDDVQPLNRYSDVNVEGQKNICTVMEELNITRHIFTSSVAVYGFVKKDTDETGEINPFNEYGQSKWDAEQVLQKWQSNSDKKQNSIIRPTVVFGENNRGNVYNLFKQIASGKFLMIGNGKNYKSMAYVENVAAFIEYQILEGCGYSVCNYIDKDDMNMNELCATIYNALEKRQSRINLPYSLGLLAGYGFDLISKLLKKPLPISSIRVKKFCGTTQFISKNIKHLNFESKVSLEEGIQNTIKADFM